MQQPPSLQSLQRAPLRNVCSILKQLKRVSFARCSRAASADQPLISVPALLSAVEPGFYTKNALYLGHTLIHMGRKEEAREWLKRCLQLPGKLADDREAHAEAEKLLKQLG